MRHEKLTARLEATLHREHGPRFLLTVDGWRRAADGSPVSKEVVDRETKLDNVARREAWARWAALGEKDALTLAGAHPPDEVGAWGFATLGDPELMAALYELLEIEHKRLLGREMIPDERLGALSRGFWTVFRARREGLAEDPPLNDLTLVELIELGAHHATPRSGDSRGDVQQRLNTARRRARRRSGESG